MGTDVRSAIRKTLADYLRTALVSSDCDQVEENWPAPGKDLPLRALTVVTPPKATIATPHQPFWWKATLIDGGPLATALYSIADVTIGLQIDAWCRFEAARDALAQAVFEKLNRPASVTVGSDDPANSYDLAPGLVLRSTDYYGILVSYRFDLLPSLPESSMASQRGTWRATWQGTVQTYLCAEKQLSTVQTANLIRTMNGGGQQTVQLQP